MGVRLHGPILLGLAVLVLPWDAPRQPETHSGAPATSRAPADGHAPAPPRAAAPLDPGPQRPRAGVPVAALAAALEPGAPSGDRAPGAVRDAPRQRATDAAPAVREFAPGSKAHSEAIASNIASEEFQEVVSPLARLYLAYFNRPPDYEGFDYYIGERERGEPLDAIAEEFAGSPEFGQRYGALDNASFVDRVFQNIFGSPADAGRRAYWIAQLESGSMTRGQVMLAFSESPAFRAATGNEVWVAMAYAETLRRAPDPADFARWVSFLDAGNPPRALIDRLLADRGKR